MRRIIATTTLIAGLALASAAIAQQGATPASVTTAATASPASGGLLGSLLPNVGAAGVGNAAGVLSYCLKNKLLGAGGATSALDKLMGRPDVAASDGFASGQAGELTTSANTSLSLASLKGKLKTRLCGMVLQHARSFL